MYLKLKTDVEIEKFYKKIYIYKSSFFKFVKFQVTDEVSHEIRMIVKGLNIKNRKKRITFVYDEACKIIDDKHKCKDTCGFINDKCYMQRYIDNGLTYGCCRFCRYKSSKGCPTKNLSCKLFNCSEVTNRYEMVAFEDLKILKLLNKRQRFILKSDYFSLREDVLKDLYSYSIIYSTIRVVYRMIKNTLYQKSKKYKEEFKKA